MAQEQNVTGIGGALFEALIEEWSSEHGEFDDLTIDSAEDLRGYIDRAVGRSGLFGNVVFAVATRLGDGSIRALSKSFGTRGEADTSWRSCWAMTTTATNVRSSLRAGNRVGSGWRR